MQKVEIENCFLLKVEALKLKFFNFQKKKKKIPEIKLGQVKLADTFSKNLFFQ